MMPAPINTKARVNSWPCRNTIKYRYGYPILYQISHGTFMMSYRVFRQGQSSAGDVVADKFVLVQSTVSRSGEAISRLGPDY